MRVDGRISHHPGMCMAVDENEGEVEDSWIDAKVWDDISGVQLDPGLVKKARAEEKDKTE